MSYPIVASHRPIAYYCVTSVRNGVDSSEPAIMLSVLGTNAESAAFSNGQLGELP